MKPFQNTLYNYYKLIKTKTMTDLQRVQDGITQMIKSDYPNPIFDWKGYDEVVFQFDSSSYHGELEITFNGIGELYMDAGNIECIGDTFMDDFKQVYQTELKELSKVRF